MPLQPPLRPATALGFFLAASLLPAAGQTPPAEPVLRLPDIKVTGTADLPPPESWRYTRTGNFEVLSNASEKATTRVLRDFQMFREALGLAWPLPQRVDAPASIILCERGNQFDRFAPADRAGSGASTASLFLQNPEQSAIVVDLQTTSLNLNELDAGTTSSTGTVEFAVDANRELYRAYIHFLLGQGETRRPAWLEEGLTQIALDMEFTERWVVFGKIDRVRGAPVTSGAAGTEEEADTTTTTVGDRPFNAVLENRALLPLNRLFAVTHDSPEALNPLGNNLWAKQSYAFVHLCLYGLNGRYAKAFGQFIQRLDREPPSEALFQECFKMSTKDMLGELRAYIGFTNHNYQTYTLKNGSKFVGDPAVLRDATQAEIGRLKGDAQRLAGRNQDALDTYRVAYLRGERDPQLLAALGVAELETGHPDRARPLLEAAAPAKVSRPGAHVALARLRLAEFTAKSGSKLETAQVRAVLAPLGTAIGQLPPLPETYQLIAQTWSHSAIPPTREQLAVLLDGVRLFPRDNELVYLTAQLSAQAGATAQAAVLARLGVKTAAEPAARARFEALLAGLPATSSAK